MKIKRILSVLLTLVIVAGLSGCGNKSKKDNNSSVSKDNQSSDNKNDVKKVNEKKHYPVEIENFDKKTVYQKAPERIIAMDYNAASTLVALGQKDKIIASREAGLLSIDDVAEKYRKDVKNIPIPEGYLKSRREIGRASCRERV